MIFTAGLISGLVLSAVMTYVYNLGKKQVKPIPISDEQKQRAERLKRDFNNIMGYTIDKARGSK